MNEKLKAQEDEIVKIVIERNKYHPTYFSNRITYKDKTQILSGGYKTLLAEIVSIYVPGLDRFCEKSQEIMLKNIEKEVVLLDEKLRELFKKISKTKNLYSLKDVKEIFRDSENEKDTTK